MSRELGLLQVSAGLNSVWALTKDGQVIHNYGSAITYVEIVGVVMLEPILTWYERCELKHGQLSQT